MKFEIEILLKICHNHPSTTMYKAAIRVLRPQAKNREMKTSAEVQTHLTLTGTTEYP